MNLKKLQSDFKIRYNRNITPLCTFSGTPLFLLGDITPEGSSVITTLSAGTALAISTDIQKSVFSIQDTQTNSLYTCKKEKLSDYHDDTPAKLIFNILGILTAQIGLKLNGAELLYMHNTSDPDFFNLISPLLTAIIHLTDEAPEKILSFLPLSGFSKKDAFSIKSTLVTKKNTAAIIAPDSLSLSALPLSGTKIVIIKTDLKRLYLDVKIKKLYSELKKTMEIPDTDPYITFPSSSQSLMSPKEQELLEFCFRENRRIHALKSSPLNLFSILNQSGNDFIKISASRELTLLYTVATDLNLHLACRPLSSGTGLYIILPDNKVDSFLEQFSERYEKKAGLKPAFFVTDTASCDIYS